MEKEKRDLERKIEGLNTQVNSLQPVTKERDELREKVDGLEKEKRDLEQKMEGLSKELNDLKKPPGKE